MKRSKNPTLATLDLPRLLLAVIDWCLYCNLHPVLRTSSTPEEEEYLLARGLFALISAGSHTDRLRKGISSNTHDLERV